MPTPKTVITVEDVERYQRDVPCALRLLSQRDIRRDEPASTDPMAVYAVTDQRVTLTQVEGGYTAEHDCRSCNQGTPCRLVTAAVDEEGTYQFRQAANAAYAVGKRALAL
jgi:hypothetical protein